MGKTSQSRWGKATCIRLLVSAHASCGIHATQCPFVNRIIFIDCLKNLFIEYKLLKAIRHRFLLDGISKCVVNPDKLRVKANFLEVDISGPKCCLRKIQRCSNLFLWCILLIQSLYFLKCLIAQTFSSPLKKDQVC